LPPTRYEGYFNRFHAIFPTYNVPSYFLPGNHDVDLVESRTSWDAHQRYISHFGPLNQRVQLANHTLLFIDALGLIEEDVERTRASHSNRQWQSKPGGAIEFIEKVQPVVSKERTILFSHVPLFRSDDASCGPSREAGNIHQGGGINSGYQNILGSSLTEFILRSIRPTIIFSGDDHDSCQHLHSSSDFQIPEITVKSMSIAMGIRRPGVQLLTLGSEPTLSLSHKLCLLPDQLGIYLSVYLPFSILSVLILAALNIQSPLFGDQSTHALAKDAATSRLRRSSSMRRMGSSVHDDDQLPHHSTRPLNSAPRSRLLSRHWLSLLSPFFFRVPLRSRSTFNHTFLSGFAVDFFSVALLPFGIFLGIAYWVGLFTS
jgi:hypothetical protein